MSAAHTVSHRPPAAEVRATTNERSALRAVAMPTEHGGWGLTAEPALLGLLVAPSLAGVALAFAAILVFLARSPLKIVLVDRWRDRHLPRTALAQRVLAVELALIAVLAGTAALLVPARVWWPALAVGPLVAVGLWFDMRSRSRRLTPELAGAVGISAAAAMIAMAGGADTSVAVGLWAIVSARAVAAIPFAREQVLRNRGRDPDVGLMVATHGIAVLVAAVTALIEPRLLAGSIAIVALTGVHAVVGYRPPTPPKVLGISQMALGFAIVAVAAVGVLVS